MKKICYVVTIGLTIRAFFIPQLKYLASHGYDVTVVCSPDEELSDLLGSDVKYIPISIPRGISFKGMLQATSKLTDLFKTEKFDLVQYSTPNAGLCAAIASKKAGIKVRNYHLMGLRYLGDKGLKQQLLRLFEKCTCALSTNIECVSKSNLKLAVRDGLFKPDKAVVVFNGSTGGLDLKRFDASMREMYRTEIRNQYNLSENDFVFGFVGRITRDKGVNEILNAFSKIDNCKLLMVGYTNETDSLDQNLYTKSLNEQSIIYTGAVTDVEKYYSAIDCLLLPSYREGFGNVIIEAAAMGCPAIVSNIPGPIDASVENKTALWVEPRNTEQLLQAMIQMKSDASKMQNQCITYVTESFDQDKLNCAILERKNNLLTFASR